jgi:DNA-binding MarR family transcriptional regulator
MADSPSFSKTVRQWMDTFVQRSMRDSARYVKASGFSMPQFFLLMHLYRHNQCGISDLSAHMEITNAATSQLVDKLVQADLLLRTEDPNDRRARQVALSSKGKRLIEQGIEERYRWVDGLEAALTEAEKDKVNEALTLMVRAVEDINEEIPAQAIR